MYKDEGDDCRAKIDKEDRNIRQLSLYNTAC